MKHLEMNLQNGVILKEEFPVGVYSKHKNTLVISIPPHLIVTDGESLKDKNVFEYFQEKYKEIVDYVVDNKILTMSKLKIKHAAHLDVGYMERDTYKMKHV